LQTDDQRQLERGTGRARHGQRDAHRFVIHLLPTEEFVLFPFAGGDVRRAERRGWRACGLIELEVQAMSIEVIARCHQKIDPHSVRGFGEYLDLEGLIGWQELRLAELGAAGQGGQRKKEAEAGEQELLQFHVLRGFGISRPSSIAGPALEMELSVAIISSHAGRVLTRSLSPSSQPLVFRSET